MQFTEILKPENIREGLLCSSKKKVLEIISHIVAEQSTSDEQACFEALCQREKKGNTGINNGIAIPHAKLPADEKAIAIFLQLDIALDYAAADHRDVDLIFAVMIPEDQCNEYCQILPELAQRLSDKNLSKQLRAAKSADEIWTILREADENYLLNKIEEQTKEADAS